MENPRFIITQWVDFSSKFGVAYMLSNNYVGMIFNDKTKLLQN